MSNELKPCPFCGSDAVHTEPSYFRDTLIYCESCDAYFTVDSFAADEHDVIEAWNRRADVAENATTRPEDAGYEPLGSRSWIIIKRTKLATETVKHLFTSQEAAEDYIRQATKQWGKSFMKGFAVEEVPIKVEKCQPEKPDDFQNAKRKEGR